MLCTNYFQVQPKIKAKQQQTERKEEVGKKENI
jgi:hypothetical protein